MRQIDFALMRRVSASSLAPSFGFLLTVFCAVAMAPPVSAGPAEAVGSAEAGPAGAGVNHPGPAAVAGRGETADLASLRNDAIAAYNRQDYAQAASFAAGYVERARAEGRIGREFAAVLFILGHARYEEEAKRGLASAAEYRAQIVLPLEESLRILQDDAVFKNMLLGNAYYELWLRSGRRDTDAEGRAHWFLLKSILLREDAARDRAKDSPEYDLFARHLLFYLERCLDLARDSANPGIYIQRIRTAAPWGFTTAYDARFWQIYDLTYFDDANLQAGVLWQRGLDAMHDPKAEVDAVLATFGQAASRTRQRKARAEIYRQMADFLSTLDEPELGGL